MPLRQMIERLVRSRMAGVVALCALSGLLAASAAAAPTAYVTSQTDPGAVTPIDLATNTAGSGSAPPDRRSFQGR